MQNSLAVLAAALAWLGARGTAAVAISAVVGICVPPLSALARPFITEAIFVLLVLAFVQVDLGAVRRHLNRPFLLASAVIWMMVILPLFGGLAGIYTGLAEVSPEFMLVIFIVLATTPIMSSPAFANLMGLDGALSLTVLVFAMLAAPFTAPAIAAAFFADSLPVTTLGLGLRLGGLLGATIATAFVVRKLIGMERIARNKSTVDGLNVVVLFIFAVAVMDGVAESILARPLLTAAITLLTFAVATAQILLTMLVFARIPRADAFTIALAVGNRNMGLLVAVIASSIPDLTWLYFALGQLPIYFTPMLLRKFAGRLNGDQ